ncbi:MAG: DUF202 domain-containing protein [Acetobacteraceae bacterium]|nr:DUF202 domain-containing protein [Acetobacteraceae bacterium]MBV8590744.1 DUF202 domain-containing protein [Acetobacteraceae bacterium]
MESTDRRTELAADRNVLADERTYAAWVRTEFTALAAGVGAKKVLGGVLPNWAILATGTVVVLFGAFCFIAAIWREIWAGAPPPQPDVRHLPRLVLISVNGSWFLCVSVRFWAFGLAGPAGASRLD